MFVLMAAGGLMATAQLKPIAKDIQLDTASLINRHHTPGADVCADDRSRSQRPYTSQSQSPCVQAALA